VTSSGSSSPGRLAGVRTELEPARFAPVSNRRRTGAGGCRPHEPHHSALLERHSHQRPRVRRSRRPRRLGGVRTRQQRDVNGFGGTRDIDCGGLTLVAGAVGLPVMAVNSGGLLCWPMGEPTEDAWLDEVDDMVAWFSKRPLSVDDLRSAPVPSALQVPRRPPGERPTTGTADGRRPPADAGDRQRDRRPR
jgi:hypothetical protein